MSKTSTLDLYREYGSAYISGLFGAKAVKGADTAEYLNLSSRTDEAWYKQFRGRTVTIGLYVYSVTATDNVKLQINDSDGTTESSFVGAGALTWVEVTRTVGAAITSFTPRVLFDGDTADVAYVSKPMLVYGSSIGEGNYQPIPQEWIEFEGNSSCSFTVTGVQDGSTAFNLEALSNGKVPKGAKAVKMNVSVTNTAADKPVTFSKSNNYQQFHVNSQVANVALHTPLTLPLKDESFTIKTWSDANFTLGFGVNGVQVN